MIKMSATMIIMNATAVLAGLCKPEFAQFDRVSSLYWTGDILGGLGLNIQ